MGRVEKGGKVNLQAELNIARQFDQACADLLSLLNGECSKRLEEISRANADLILTTLERKNDK
jgi:hypothetical protein